MVPFRLGLYWYSSSQRGADVYPGKYSSRVFGENTPALSTAHPYHCTNVPLPCGGGGGGTKTGLERTAKVELVYKMS